MEKQKTKIQKFEEILGAKCESVYMHVKEIMGFIEKQPKGKQDELWKFLIENFTIIHSDLEIKADKDYGDVWDKWKDEMKVKASAFLDDVNKRNGEPEEVVGLLKENLQKIKKKEGKIIFLAHVLMGKGSIVPYFRLKYPVLDGEYIKNIPEDFKRKMGLVERIATGNTRFEKSREICTAIAQIIDEEEDMKRKILLMGVTIMKTIEKSMPSGIIAVGMPLSLKSAFLNSLLSMGSEHKAEDCKKCSDLRVCILPQAKKAREELGIKPG